MQVLDLSVGSMFPIPLTACMVSTGDAADLSSCSVLVDYNSSTGNSLAAGSSLGFKAFVDESCTGARVYSGLCSACTAAAATAGTCPPGKHTFILDVGEPVGVESSTILGMVFHVGSSLLSAGVVIKFELSQIHEVSPVLHQGDAKRCSLCLCRVRFDASTRSHSLRFVATCDCSAVASAAVGCCASMKVQHVSSYQHHNSQLASVTM
jgi:hypothetical protein